MLIHRAGMELGLQVRAGLAPSTLAADTGFEPLDLPHKAEKPQADAVFKLHPRLVQPAG